MHYQFNLNFLKKLKTTMRIENFLIYFLFQLIYNLIKLQRKMYIQYYLKWKKKCKMSTIY